MAARKERVIRVGWVMADPTTTAYAPAARHLAASAGVPMRPSAITGTSNRVTSASSNSRSGPSVAVRLGV